MTQFYRACILVLAVGCSSAKNENPFNAGSKREVIAANGLKWSQALTTGDTAIIQAIYDQDAHYIPDGFKALHGNAAIVHYWKGSFSVLKDVRLTMETLEGTKDLLYETGHGYSLILNEKNDKPDTFLFKYVNVWKLQPDGNYKVVIDTYNDVPKASY